MILYWFGLNVPTSSSSSRAFVFNVYSRGYKRAREGAGVPSLWIACVCMRVCVWVWMRRAVMDASVDALRKVRLPPFIVQGVSIYMEGEGKSGGRANSDPSLSSVQCPMVGPVDLSWLNRWGALSICTGTVSITVVWKVLPTESRAIIAWLSLMAILRSLATY